MKYKINDILRVKSGCEGKCGTFVSVGGEFIKITGVNQFTYDYDILDKDLKKIGYCSCCLKDEHLEPYEKTWETLQEGDVVIDSQGAEQTVLGVCGKVIMLSCVGYPMEFDSGYTGIDLTKIGYTIKDAKPIIEELTVEEICKELGREVKIRK